MLLLGIGIKVANLPQIVSEVNEKGKYEQMPDLSTGVLSLDALTILRVFMFLIPIPICLIGYIVYKKKYNLYGARYDEIKAEIERRRALAESVEMPEGEVEGDVVKENVEVSAAEVAASVNEENNDVKND